MIARDRNGRAWMLGMLLLVGGSTVLAGCGGKDKKKKNDQPAPAAQPAK